MSDKPQITLYTAPTPNGFKISIALEELGVPYEVRKIDFSKNEQKEPWFLEINPNGRIPAITDNRSPANDGKPFHVFESGAILEYLVHYYDKDHKISYPEGSKEFWQAKQWLHFQKAGLGPMQGQANHFYRYAPEKIPYGIKRYQDETARLYSVLEKQLASNPHGYLVGDRPTVADIASFGWARGAFWAGVDLAPFPKVREWIDRLAARPAVAKGVNVPEGGRDLSKLSEEEAEKEAEKARQWILQQQQQQK